MDYVLIITLSLVSFLLGRYGNRYERQDMRERIEYQQIRIKRTLGLLARATSMYNWVLRIDTDRFPGIQQPGLTMMQGRCAHALRETRAWLRSEGLTEADLKRLEQRYTPSPNGKL